MRAILVTVLVALLVVTTACDREEPAPTAAAMTPSPTTVSSTPSASPTAVPTFVAGIPRPAPIPLSPPPPDARLENGLALAHVGSGTVHALYEGPEYPWTPGFGADGTVWARLGPDQYGRFDRDGRLLTRSATPVLGGCEQVSDATSDRFLVDGRWYDGRCWSRSPGSRYLFYTVDLEGRWTGRYEARLLRLADLAEIRLTDKLRHCGGCDGFAVPSWSASGRYIIFGETGGGEDSTVYVANAETGETRGIARGINVNHIGLQPRWSPREDAFISASPDGSTMLTRLPSTQSSAFPEIRWPAQFDESGRYVYAIAGGLLPLAPGQPTVLWNVETGSQAVTWQGSPRSWPVERGVSQVNAEPVGLLEGDPSCVGGVVVHHPQLAGGKRCVQNASGAAWGPQYMSVAFARVTSTEPPPMELRRTYSAVLLLDLRSGQEREVIRGLHGSGSVPPLIRWSPDGSRLLILWPGPNGI